jgi:nucleotide-binding universal stress UspA family protein
VQNILVGSDLSPDSDRALEAGARLSAISGARLHVFHCMPTPVFPFWEGAVLAEGWKEWEENARVDLDWQVRRVLPGIDSVATVEVAMGTPVERINAKCAEHDADLLVLGPHRSRGLFDDLLGTTADRLLRTAEVPILIASREVEAPPRRVLIPTDFSEQSDRAFLFGLGWLAMLLRNAEPERPCTVQLLFVSAFAPPSARPTAARTRLAELLEGAERDLPEARALRVLPRIISAPMPEDGIRAVAEDSEVDLIIIGTHGHNALSRALIGSVVSKVVRTIARPILLVPPALRTPSVPRG